MKVLVYKDPDGLRNNAHMFLSETARDLGTFYEFAVLLHLNGMKARALYPSATGLDHTNVFVSAEGFRGSVLVRLNTRVVIVAPTNAEDRVIQCSSLQECVDVVRNLRG